MQKPFVGSQPQQEISYHSMYIFSWNRASLYPLRLDALRSETSKMLHKVYCCCCCCCREVEGLLEGQLPRATARHTKISLATCIECDLQNSRHKQTTDTPILPHASSTATYKSLYKGNSMYYWGKHVKLFHCLNHTALRPPPLFRSKKGSSSAP